jgi:3-ketosteroid 9alpha-monooxygenase subunit B
VPIWTLTVTDVICETADAVTVVFEPPDGSAVGYAPGQFLTLRVPSEETGSVARCYSLCSSPVADRRLAVTVKRTAGGYASNWLCDHVRPGLQFQSLPPAGAFTPQDLSGDLLLIAAGSGITPMVSIIRTILAGERGSVVLFYANRDPASVIFASHLRDLVSQHPDRLAVVHWLETVQGLPSDATLLPLLSWHSEREVFICGPKPFMRSVRAASENAGVPRSRIHLENFVSLTADPFLEVDCATAQPTSEPSTRHSAQLEVEINGGRHSFTWTTTDTLIDLLVKEGIEAPYSCREGQCGTCQCVVTAGEVTMDTRGALDDEDIADGIILGCQARPVSDHITIEF